MIEVESKIDEDRTKFWYIKGTNIYHREDGPAVEYANGNKSYYYQDKFIDVKTDEEYFRLVKLKAFW